ncbi:YbaB/EbfC family nucleoid-associated protein [Candidatus Uhrbacteria bacterium]|nr:YbaB/EbfC family nucleoid-associated protein [Candidatus Uhrbacteria bacterium]
MGFFDKFQDLKKARELQAMLAKEVVDGSSKDGTVHVTIDGNQNVLRVSIDDSIVHDKHKLEQNTKDAFVRGLDALKKLMASKFSSVFK